MFARAIAYLSIDSCNASSSGSQESSRDFVFEWYHILNFIVKIIKCCAPVFYHNTHNALFCC